MKPFRCEGAAFTLRTPVVLGAAIILAACNGGPVQKSSSSADSSSVATESSSVAFSSSSLPSSSSVASSSSEISSEQSSSEVSSSSLPAPVMKEVVVPRTTCPQPPENLSAEGGSWPAHHAISDYPVPQYDTVAMFKDYMKPQSAVEHRGVVMQWSMHTPFQADQNPDAKYPLVVYLHGGAEARIEGNGPGFLDNRHAKNFFASNTSLLTVENQERFPAYIIAPYCDGKANQGTRCSFGAAEWASNGYGAINAQLNGDGSPYGAAVEKLIEDLIEQQQVDPARIYVTGPSMGGGGSWDIAARRPDLIAASIPLAGHPLSDSALQILADHKVPVWSHHGASDNTNGYDAANRAIESLANKGGCAWQTTYFPSNNLGDDDPGDSDPSDATHNIWARAYTNPDFWPWVFSIAQPTETQLGYPDSSSSAGSAFEGETLGANNHYDAPKAAAAPVIDGEIDDVWSAADWMAMDVAWTQDFGFQAMTPPQNSQDFSGRYKAVWTEEHLYLLFEILDEHTHISGGGQTWQGDTIEIFLDEDQSGGNHEHDFNAFAYHIGYSKIIEDTGGNIDGHVTVEIKTEGNHHIWEMAIEIYTEHNGYNQTEQEAARVTLEAGKIMGFTPSYIDNDDNGGREHFMSSVDTVGHQTNQGYISADHFGSIALVQ